jgi:uncharacterized protein YydD (DUF2326 family)
MNNGEISLAIINTKLEYIQTDINEIKKTLEKMNDLADNHSNRISSLEVQTKNIGIFQATFTAIAASIAAWLGRQS